MTRSRNKNILSEARWQQQLTPEQFRICRLKETEVPFSGKYDKHFGQGLYTCVCCGNNLFYSDTKYDSGSGWPSFYQAADPDAVQFKEDHSHGMTRTEVLCRNCGSHLGHIFDDGPAPTGKRYCINSIALNFVEKT